MDQPSRERIENKAREMEVDISWAIEAKKLFTRQEINNLNVFIKEDIAFLSDCKSSLDRALILQRIEKQRKEIKRIQSYLYYLANPHFKKITDYDIEQARSYPIEKLLPYPVRKNITRCPFHKDNHPSMSTKDNFALCFTCNKSWDTIALIMELQKIDFVGAIKYLRGGDQ